MWRKEPRKAKSLGCLRVRRGPGPWARFSHREPQFAGLQHGCGCMSRGMSELCSLGAGLGAPPSTHPAGSLITALALGTQFKRGQQGPGLMGLKGIKMKKV